MKRRTSVAAPNFLLKHSNPAIGAVFFQMGSFDEEGEMRGMRFGWVCGELV